MKNTDNAIGRSMNLYSVFKRFAEFVDRMVAPDCWGDIPHDPQIYGISHERKIFRAVSAMHMEAGEAHQLMHKVVFRGHDLDITQLTLEVGDVLFHMQQYCDAVNITLEELAQRNMTKLTERYPNGYDATVDKARKGP